MPNLDLSHDLAECRRVLQQTQEQLQGAWKLESIGRLAAGIAHEINTPAQFLGDNLAFLQDTFQDVLALLGRLSQGANLAEVPEFDLEFVRKEIPEALAASQEGLHRIDRIVKAMRRFSHPSLGEFSLAALDDIITTSMTVSASEWKYVASVETHFDPELPPILCIRDELSQVVLNLLVNAAHAIREKGEPGKIVVRTRRLASSAELSIEDNGTGIPESAQGRVFEPFFTTKAVGKGTGQGLSMAYRVIVEKHSGRLSFQSTPGQGTNFTIELPLSS